MNTYWKKKLLVSHFSPRKMWIQYSYAFWNFLYYVVLLSHFFLHYLIIIWFFLVSTLIIHKFLYLKSAYLEYKAFEIKLTFKQDKYWWIMHALVIHLYHKMRIFLSNTKLSFSYWLTIEVNLTTTSVNNLCNQLKFFDQSPEYKKDIWKLHKY